MTGRVEQDRIEAAASRIERVLARLVTLDRAPNRDCSSVRFLPTEQRLLQESLDLLDAKVNLA